MPSAVAAPQTLYDKVLRDHTVDEKDDGTILLYIGTALAIEFNHQIPGIH
jgi:3-isopropylmalate dehydratase